MKIIVLPGDGIGPEVTREAVRIADAVASMNSLEIEFVEGSIGGHAIKQTGQAFPPATRELCASADCVLLGAVGDPECDHLLPKDRPEMGLLELRTQLGGFANLRPSRAVSTLLDSSPLKNDRVEGTDLIIVRELLGGLYFGEPRGFNDANRSAFNTMAYTEEEIERVAKVAFHLANKRRRKLTSVDKANVLETSRLWRETVERVGTNYPNVELEHLFVDACAMHLVMDPRRFDVILTENLFGDILSDEAAVLTGSLGMLASATVGGSVDLYEPVHGSAPDIAGKNIANPLGSIASVALMFRYTFRNESAAKTIENAIDRVLFEGNRTIEIAGSNDPRVLSTSEMGDRVLECVKEGISHFAASQADGIR